MPVCRHGRIALNLDEKFCFIWAGCILKKTFTICCARGRFYSKTMFKKLRSGLWLLRVVIMETGMKKRWKKLRQASTATAKFALLGLNSSKIMKHAITTPKPLFCHRSVKACQWSFWRRLPMQNRSWWRQNAIYPKDSMPAPPSALNQARRA